MSLKQISEVKVSGGRLLRVEHLSAVCNGSMTFAIFLPPQAKQVTETKMVPVLYWLSGLTCNDENFSQKAGAFSMATKLGMAIVMPDTSPRDAAIGAKTKPTTLALAQVFTSTLLRRLGLMLTTCTVMLQKNCQVSFKPTMQ